MRSRSPHGKPTTHTYIQGRPHSHPTPTHVSREPCCLCGLDDSIPHHVVPGPPSAHQPVHASPCHSRNPCLCRQWWGAGRCPRRRAGTCAEGSLARGPGRGSCGRGQGMRGSVQAAGRKPVPNNRGKWRNWKKTQWQHSQHRWFSAEQHDSWEKGPQHSADSLRLCPWAAPANKLGMGIPSRAGPCGVREPRDVPPCLKLRALAVGHRGPSGLGVGGRLSPLCLPVSHADLSHALASSERDYGLVLPAAEPSPSWPAQELIPWEGLSCSPLSASSSLLCRDTPLAAPALILLPHSPVGSRAQDAPALSICSTTLSVSP